MPRSSQRRRLKKSSNRAWDKATPKEKENMLEWMKMLRQYADNINGEEEKRIFVTRKICGTIYNYWSKIAKFLNEYKIGITRDGKLYRVLETTKEYLTDNCTIYGRKYNLEDLPSINVTTGYNVTVKGGERLKDVELGEGTVDKTLL